MASTATPAVAQTDQAATTGSAAPTAPDTTPSPADTDTPAAPPNASPHATAPAQSDAAAPDPNKMVQDSLAALGSLWSGWMAPSPTTMAKAADASSQSASTAATTTDDVAPNPGGNTTATNPDGNKAVAQSAEAAQAAAAAAAAAASDLWSGAGKMWQSAVEDVSARIKETAQNVDAGTLEEQVSVLRQKSGRLVEDVTRGVQGLNIQLPASTEGLGGATRELLDRAGQSLDRAGQVVAAGGREAMEIFVDGEQNGNSAAGAADGAGGDGAKVGTAATETALPPWDATTLPEGERKYADALRREMLKLVVDAIYSKKKRVALFLSGAAERERFTFELDEKAGVAQAGLEADPNLRRLRAGLVPGKMKEEGFWRTYFYHVHRVRQVLVANDGQIPDAEDEAADEDDPAALFGEEDDELRGPGQEPKSEAAPAKAAEASGEEKGAAGGKDGRDWEDEIDKLFEEDEG